MSRDNKGALTTPTIIRLPLVRPVGCKEEVAFGELSELARQCDQARNSMLRFWLRWREDHPEWSPDAKIDKAGKPRTKKTGEIIRANLPAPSVDGVTFGTAMYRHGASVYPMIGRQCVSMLSQEVWARLRQRAAWKPGLRAFSTWEAILLNEQSVPSYRQGKIPMHYRSIKMSWADCLLVEFQAWSKQQETTRLQFECKVANLPGRLKKLLDQCVQREVAHCCSHVIRGKRFWEMHLVIMQADKSSECDPARVLLLEACGPDEPRPFQLVLPDGEVVPIGSGIPLVREHERLTLRRKAIRTSGRLGATKGGHGMRRIMRAVTSEARRYGGVQSAFARQLADIVYSVAVRTKCGTVQYQEPSVRERDGLWFARRDTPFNWTMQLDRLVGKLKRRGITLLRKESKDENYVTTGSGTEAAGD